MIRSIIWLLGVIAAALAIVTNIIVIAAVSDVNNRVMALQTELYAYEDHVEMVENNMDILSNMYAEIQAQVEWGLLKHYDLEDF